MRGDRVTENRYSPRAFEATQRVLAAVARIYRNAVLLPIVRDPVTGCGRTIECPVHCRVVAVAAATVRLISNRRRFVVAVRSHEGVVPVEVRRTVRLSRPRLDLKGG